MEQTCNLAVLTPSKTIPSGGGTRRRRLRLRKLAGLRARDNCGRQLSTPPRPWATRRSRSSPDFPRNRDAPNPLAGRPYVLLRDSYANALAKAASPSRRECRPTNTWATFARAARRTVKRSWTLSRQTLRPPSAPTPMAAEPFPALPPGTYYLMISTRYNNQGLVWGQPVQLKAGPNSVTLDQRNAAPLN